MSVGIEELEEQINQMRMMLILIAEKSGLNSADTLSCSRKLDELITMYQTIKIPPKPVT